MLRYIPCLLYTSNSYSYQKYGEATAGTTLLAVIILVITLCTYQTIAKNEVEL